LANAFGWFLLGIGPGVGDCVNPMAMGVKPLLHIHEYLHALDWVVLARG
jgi:hypothetical protein